MPYTPPARTTGSSPIATPEDVPRSPRSQPTRTVIPRSASYLNRQPRRNESWFDQAVCETADNTLQNSRNILASPLARANQPTPSATFDDLQKYVTTTTTATAPSTSTASSSSIRQSPPPPSDGRPIPQGALLSPPDSGNNSSDEAEDAPHQALLECQLKELKEAISLIPQHRAYSPTGAEFPLAGDDEISALDSEVIHPNLHLPFFLPSRTGRKISHSKSITDPAIVVSAYEAASACSDPGPKPERPVSAMVRKKSGEIVRPALRPTTQRRPSSMPGTPTYKNVHFDSHLEQVRHFCNVDRPSAISTTSSPVESYDTEDEFPFNINTKTPSFEWELVVNNFPQHRADTQWMPVRMERFYLSPDQKSLCGSVIVQNLAFHKSVTCRFTLDYWKTVSEVSASYTSDVQPCVTPIGLDRFVFNIKLADTANLESKTLYCCVRYNVNGQEHWDSNNGANFQIDFRKKLLPQNGKNGFQGASKAITALPRSNSRRAGFPQMRKPFDDFLDEIRADNEVELRIRRGKSAPGLGRRDSQTVRRRDQPTSQFAARYNFDASFKDTRQAARDAAKAAAAKNDDDDGLYMKSSSRHDAPEFSNSGLKTMPYNEMLSKYCFFGSGSSAAKDDVVNSPSLSQQSSKTSLNSFASAESAAAPRETPNPPDRGQQTSSPCSKISQESLSPPVNSFYNTRSPSPHNHIYTTQLVFGSLSFDPPNQSSSRSSSPGQHIAMSPISGTCIRG